MQLLHIPGKDIIRETQIIMTHTCEVLGYNYKDKVACRIAVSSLKNASTPLFPDEGIIESTLARTIS